MISLGLVGPKYKRGVNQVQKNYPKLKLLCRIYFALQVYFEFFRPPSSNVYDPSFCPVPPFFHSLPTSAEANPLPAQCDNTAQQKGADKYDAHATINIMHRGKHIWCTISPATINRMHRGQNMMHHFTFNHEYDPQETNKVDAQKGRSNDKKCKA